MARAPHWSLDIRQHSPAILLMAVDQPPAVVADTQAAWIKHGRNIRTEARRRPGRSWHSQRYLPPFVSRRSSSPVVNAPRSRRLFKHRRVAARRPAQTRPE